MKKIIILLCCLWAIVAQAQNVNIPDANFKNYLISMTNINTNGDTEIQVSEANSYIGTISASDRNISDLTGIEAFTNITGLFCSRNQLTTLDVSNNTALTSLYCSRNQLTALDVSSNYSLTALYCDSNQLTNLNVQNNNNSNINWFRSKGNPNLTCIQIDAGFYPSSSFTWQKDIFVAWSSNCATYTPCSQIVNIPDASFKSYLVNNYNINTDGDGEICLNEAQAFTGTIDCSNRNIADLTGIEAFTNLKELDCKDNQLTSLDVSANTALEKLNCYRNPLGSLDVSNNLNLKFLWCYDNQLSSLDISNNTNLYWISCNANNLTSLDISNNTALTHLYCADNDISSIDISMLPHLQTLWVYQNKLSNLDVSANTKLKEFFCYTNQLTHLDLSANDSLTDLRCDANQLEYLNLANGNNDSLIFLRAVNNPNLTCIQHDASFNPTTNTGWQKDATANWSSDCGYVLVSSIAVQGQGGVNTISTQGGTLQMEASILPANASYKTYTWSVANGTGSATINANGLLTAVADGTVIVTATANDASATTGSATITISNQSVSINDIVFEGLKVYPNPTNGKLHIDLAHNQLNEINILDLTGKKIKQYTKQLHTIDISNLAKGGYFLELKNNNKHTTIKIIKK